VVPRVEGFLRDVGAGGIVNLLSREDADTLATKMGSVSVPTGVRVGRDGRLVRRFDDDDATRRLGRPFTYADVEEAVREALGR